MTEAASSRSRPRIARIAILAALLAAVTGGSLLLRCRANAPAREPDFSGLPPAAVPGARALAHGNYAAAANALEQLPPNQQTVDTLVMLGVAHGKQGQTDLAVHELRTAAARAPKDPRPRYWETYFLYRAHRIDEEQLLAEVSILHGEYGTPEAVTLADQLEVLLDAPE